MADLRLLSTATPLIEREMPRRLPRTPRSRVHTQGCFPILYVFFLYIFRKEQKRRLFQASLPYTRPYSLSLGFFFFFALKEMVSSRLCCFLFLVVSLRAFDVRSNYFVPGGVSREIVEHDVMDTTEIGSPVFFSTHINKNTITIGLRKKKEIWRMCKFLHSTL